MYIEYILQQLYCIEGWGEGGVCFANILVLICPFDSSTFYTVS
jgi:hypothetical protein